MEIKKTENNDSAVLTLIGRLDAATAPQLQEMAEAVGCHVLMLPKYSPDLNPIEHEWANLKTFLRNHGRHYASIKIAIYHYFKSA